MSDIITEPNFNDGTVLFKLTNGEARYWAKTNVPTGKWIDTSHLLVDLRVAEDIVDEARYAGLSVHIDAEHA